MQDAASPLIARCVNQLLRYHFFVDRIISRQFPTSWSPRSLDLKPCNIWLWESLSVLKESIERYVRNIPQFMLFSTIECANLRFQMIADIGGRHIEHMLYIFIDYIDMFSIEYDAPPKGGFSNSLVFFSR